MPVSVITDVITWIEMILQIGVSTVELGVLTYLVFQGGWLDMLRLIAFWLDLTIIKYIDYFYKYFVKILGGQIFSPTVVENVMKNMYIFVSLFVLLRLLLLFMKYLSNPEMVSDDKVGAQALIKRVILGMCGMLALPMIFNFSIDLQHAILNDNLFGKILMDKKDLKTYEKNQNQMGRMLAFNVYQAFWNLDSKKVSDAKLQKEYDEAISLYDPGVITNINEKYGSDYAYDYFPIASTVVLIYVIYLVIKYCIDVVVRMFKLFLLQMLGPLAISDYMVNGDSKDVFKNWLKTTLSVYAMLFVRIFSIWFIAFIMVLMQGKCTHFEKDPNTGEPTDVCADESLLYIEPGAEPDYLLRGIITLGLLAMLMDMPKFLSDILGLDLEQDATVKGLMQKTGGALKGVAMGGLAVGGAAVGGAIGGAKNSLLGMAQRTANKAKFNAQLSKDSSFMGQLQTIRADNDLTERQKGRSAKALRKSYARGDTQYAKDFRDANRAANAKIVAGTTGIATAATAALMSATPGLKNISSGYSQGKSEVNNREKEREDYQNQLQEASYAKAYAKEAAKLAENEKEKREREEDIFRNVTERIVETQPKGTPIQDIKANLIAQVYGEPNEITARVNGQLAAISSSGQSVDLPTVTQEIKQVLGERFDVAPGEVEQVVKQVVKDTSNITPHEVEQIVNQVIGNRVAASEDTINQVVNQVYGTRVNNSVDDATQTINQTLNAVNTTVSDTTQTITQKIDQQIDISRNINDNISQSVEIQKDIRINTEETNVYAELTTENTEILKNK